MAPSAPHPLAALPGAVSAELSGQPITLALALAVLGLVPLLFMSLTAFVKISTVLTIARSALGAPDVPSGPILLSLSLALTVVAMAPVGEKIEHRLEPVLATVEQKSFPVQVTEVARTVRAPLVDFLRDNASPRQRRRFATLLANSTPGADVQDLRILVPAFLVTQLMEAFLVGFAIYLPFLVVDLVVANVLTALGLVALSTDRVSLPLKLLLFVAADGWGALAQSLVTGYKT